MRVAVVRETRDGETRVAMVPELVGALTTLGYEVVVEPGAGHGALITNEDYVAAGACIDAGALDTADLVVAVQPLDPHAVRRLRRGTVTISFLPVDQQPGLVADLRDHGVTALAMERVPRISRA